MSDRNETLQAAIDASVALVEAKAHRDTARAQARAEALTRRQEWDRVVARLYAEVGSADGVRQVMLDAFRSLGLAEGQIRAVPLSRDSILRAARRAER